MYYHIPGHLSPPENSNCGPALGYTTSLLNVPKLTSEPPVVL